ncbi:MAG: hypothetical protein VB025_07460 [Sphaerochaeta sp.]|nr:hypothetical protein [Sphaerochaeta sp.]
MADKKTKPETAETEEKPKHPGGRPKAGITKREFERLLKLNPTSEEVSACFGVHRATLHRWCRDTYGESFATLLKQSSGTYKISVRRKLDRLADKSAAAAIFLSKNILGFSDNPAPAPSGEERAQFSRALHKAAKLWGEHEGSQEDSQATEDDE